MIINHLIILLSIFITCSCSEPSKEVLFAKERDKRICGALRKFKNAMELKGYYVGGIGEGIDHSTGKQNYLGVTFETESLPDIDYARKLEVEMLQEFLGYINAEAGIENYIAEYPFSLKYAYIAFISRHPETGLFSVSNCEEKLYYHQDNPINPFGPSIEIHRELYQDAVNILDQQQDFRK